MTGDGAQMSLAGLAGRFEHVPVDVRELQAGVLALPESDRGEVFELLVARWGRVEASRLWLAVFAASDAAAT